MEGQVFFWVCKLEPAYRVRSVSQKGWARGKQGAQQVWFAHRALGENLPVQRLERDWRASPISFYPHSLIHNHSPKPLT